MATGIAAERVVSVTEVTVIVRVWFGLSSTAAAPVGETTSTLIPGIGQQPPPPLLLLPPPQPRRKVRVMRPQPRYFTKSFSPYWKLSARSLVSRQTAWCADDEH